MVDFVCATQEIRDGWSTGWRVVACAVNYEDSELFCDHSGEESI